MTIINKKDELENKVSKETLEYFINNIHSEQNEIDFKQCYALDSSKDRAELVRDIIAFANTEGGGHIIFGVEDGTGEPVGLHGEHLDMTRIHNVLKNYVTTSLNYRVNEHCLYRADWSEKRRFGILYIAEAATIIVPQKQVAYEDDKRKPKVAVDVHDIVIRLGAQSTIADQATLAQLVKRKHITDNFEQRRELEGNLPAKEDITTEFIGRMQELEDLRKWFEDVDSKTWMLTGDGGKGKTAIAYEFAIGVKKDAPKNFEYVLWLSAKSRQFQGGEVQNIDPTFWDQLSLVDAIVSGYGFDDDDYVKLPEMGRRGVAKNLLTELPALLIADDIDSLETKNEKAILFLISEIAFTPSKVLFTSRRG